MKNQIAFKHLLPHYRWALALAILLLWLAGLTAFGQVLPPSSVPYGLNYSDWAAKWWQWTLSQSTNQIPLVSGSISGPVEFLAGAPGSVNETRNVTIPAGTALFFPVLANWADNSDCPVFDTNTLAQLQAIEDGNWSVVSETTCTIDGVAVANLDNPQTTPYFTKASPFSYTTALSNSVLNTVYADLPCIPGGTTVSPAVADGVYLMLAPLAPGIHTIHFIGVVGPTNAPYVTMNLTYQVTVNNLFPPNATPYGLSYADWAAKWWQWTLSQSTNQIPLVSGLISGPVEFLAGAPGSVNETRNVTIPAGTALFFPVLSTWADNSDCPVFDTNTLAQLQAIADGNWGVASETTCTIDGVAVTNLDNPQTSPYFTKATPFSYTTALSNSVLNTGYADLPCIPGGTTVSPAVADGVYLMLAPLAPGIHTIHFIGIVGPTNAPYVTMNLTYQVTVSNNYFAPNVTPYGVSYEDWAAKWWQWTLSQSTDQTNNVSDTISGPVKFLAGAPGSVSEARNVAVPAGTALFFPVLANWADNSDCPVFDTNTLAQLQAIADGNWSVASETVCTIDGLAVTNLDNPQTSSYFSKATPFGYTTALNDSVLQTVYGDLPCIAGGTPVSPAVADGVYIMTAPLAPGIHTIHLIGIVGPTNAPYVHQELTYQVTALNPTGNYPPAAAPYGISNADWAAKWWQWNLSHSTDQTPLVSGPISGPVQFLAGAPGSTTATRNITLPAGTAVFFPILANWDDNSDCPNFDTNSLAQLQATEDGNWSAVTATACTIDGVAVTGLDNPQTTGYYVQATPFSYVTATNDSVIDLPCVPGGTTIGPAVADGVYLMSAPLAAGLHTIHFVGIVGPITAPYVHQDTTYQITVLPISLSITAQGSSTKLSWPQRTINYGVENSTVLNSQIWSPVTTPIQTNNGNIQTIVTNRGSQFFRLRSQQ